MRYRDVAATLGIGVALTFGLSAAQAVPLMIVGNDEKILWDDQGKAIMSPSGKDSVLIVDLADPLNPKIIANLPLENSVVGPPVNLDIDPTGSVALVADSVTVAKEGDTMKFVPTDKIYVIDLKANPPKLAGTVTGSKQPSGLSFSPSGNIALVANRADKSISVLSVKGTDVKVIDTVAMGDEVSQVVFTPDGKRALATKFAAHKVAVLEVDGEKVTYGKTDITVGLWPYNIVVSPDGKIAITADNGGAGSSDGNVDTVSIIDLELKPPRVIDKVVVGDGPEGLAMSPKGNLAVTAILAGSNNKAAFFHRAKGYITVLRIDGKKVTRIKELDVGGLPEAAVFTPDGGYILIGNYLDEDFSIFKVDGTEVTDTGKRFKVPGHPASARMSPK
jgi:DNA-binding beta-propeller fold protein YncE